MMQCLSNIMMQYWGEWGKVFEQCPRIIKEIVQSFVMQTYLDTHQNIIYRWEMHIFAKNIFMQKKNNNKYLWTARV